MDVSGPQLASILGLTDRQVRALSDQGVVVKLDHGRYDLERSVQGYIRYKIKTEVAAVQTDPGSARIRDLKAEDLKLRMEERSQALIAEARAEAIAIVDEYAGPLRSDMLSIPARITKDLALRRIMEAEIAAAFGAASKRAAAAGSPDLGGASPPNRAARRTARARR